MEQCQMNAPELIDTARNLVANDKGLLAMDESNPTCHKRFAKLGIPQTVEARRAWRQLIVSTPGLGECISGAILYDETIRQQKKDGTPMIKALIDAGIIPGIKVDAGAMDMAAHPGEKITEGLDGLRTRLGEYFAMGARFAKWRAVITVGAGIPSRGCIQANAHALARYASLCQEAGLVPIVEPEVLMDGEHPADRCAAVTAAGLLMLRVLAELADYEVALDAVVLKPNMVLPGSSSNTALPPGEVAARTVDAFIRLVPEQVAGIAFLSGGQRPDPATANLAALRRLATPWPLTFSFWRALVDPALAAWRGDPRRAGEGQQPLANRVACNLAALRGGYR